MPDNRIVITQTYLEQLQRVLAQEDLQPLRHAVQEITGAAGIDLLDCAAALLHLQLKDGGQSTQSSTDQMLPKAPLAKNLLGIKMLRYRLEVGSNHQVTVEALMNLLVDESGVDRSNIANVNIQADYTLIELPDEMPIDIFQHLKTVEINQRPLAIKRLKARNKRRNTNRFRRGRQRGTAPAEQREGS